MDKRILDLVNDFPQWRGNPFTLATLVSELQQEIDAEALVVPEPPPEVPPEE